MWLPFSNRISWSKQNGWILVTAQNEVWVGGITQTSARYALLWEDAFMKSSPLLMRKAAQVLMLGLGGGGALKAIHDAYPGCRVTAVEFDPTMLDIAQRLQARQPFPFPKVIIADAKDALAGLPQYDVIVVDIFNGRRPSKHIDDGAFWDLVAARLNPGGVAVLNVAIDSTRHYAAQKHFKKHATWQYDANTFCALSN